MERINRYEHEADWTDVLFALADSARRMLLALKRSRCASEPATDEQRKLLDRMGLYCPVRASRDEAQQLMDRRYQSLLVKLLEQGP